MFDLDGRRAFWKKRSFWTGAAKVGGVAALGTCVVASAGVCAAAGAAAAVSSSYINNKKKGSVKVNMKPFVRQAGPGVLAFGLGYIPGKGTQVAYTSYKLSRFHRARVVTNSGLGGVGAAGSACLPNRNKSCSAKKW